MKNSLILIPFLVLLSLAGAETGVDYQKEEVFFRANQAYKEGRFQDAIDGYLRLIQSGHGNGNVYYNLGNAYIRSDQLGRAILNYERAHILWPRDADLDFNLRYARDRMRDAIPDRRGIVGMTFFWLGSLSLGELFRGFAVLNGLFWAILLIRLFRRSEWTYYISAILLIFWIMAGASFGLKWYQAATDDRAVILEKEAKILAGPEPQDTLLFKLHEGTIVHHERSEEGWSLVRLTDKKRGWVIAEAIECIRPLTLGNLFVIIEPVG